MLPTFLTRKCSKKIYEKGMLHNNTANVNKDLFMLSFSAYYYRDSSNFLNYETYLLTFLKDHFHKFIGSITFYVKAQNKNYFF